MDFNMISQLKIIDDICEGSKSLNRQRLLDYENMAKKMPQIEIPVIHHIHGGMYGREITIPKDTIITGQIYKFDHFDVMISGDITVSTDTGERKRYKGYNCFKGMSGKKRAGYAHEDTTWITFHPFIGQSGDDIQKLITADTFEELNIFNTIVNVNDYKSLVDLSLMTEEEIRSQVENIKDLIDMPLGYESIYTKTSMIEGKGLFSSKNILSGDVICPSRIKGKRTIAGRFTNHALIHNAKMVFNGNDMDLVCCRDIDQNEEITVNYRDVIKTRNNMGDLLCQE